MAQEALFNDGSGDVKHSKTPSSKKSTTGRPEYGNLIGIFADECLAAHGHKPPRQIVQRMAQQCAKLANERIAVEVMQEAVRLVARRGNPPSTLPDVVFEVQAKSGPVARDREAIRMFLENHDGSWPTGAKFIRGTHAGTYVYDPLGYDKIPGGYNLSGTDIHRPSRQEILDALKGK